MTFIIIKAIDIVLGLRVETEAEESRPGHRGPRRDGVRALVRCQAAAVVASEVESAPATEPTG